MIATMGSNERRWAALLAVLAAALLIWTADACLGASVFRPTTERVRFRIEAPAPTAKAAEALAAQLWLNAITIDGYADPAAVQWQGKWESQYGMRVHMDASPAHVEFEGRSAVLQCVFSRWSGIATVHAGAHSAPLDLYSNGNDRRMVDLPAWERPWWSAAPWLVLVGLALLAVRPWSSHRRTAAWGIGVLIAVHAIFWLTMPIAAFSDAISYLDHFWRAVKQGAPDYFPVGYGMLMAAVQLLPGDFGSNLALVHHAMMVVSLLLLWRLAAAMLPWSLSILALYGCTWLGPTLLLPQALLSENLVLFTLATALYMAQRTATCGGLPAAIAAGVCLGWATIARAIPLAAAGPAMLMTLTVLRPRGAWLRRGIVVFGIAAAITVVPMGWFWWHGHGFTLSTGVGNHLFNRVVYEQKLIDRNGPATFAMQQRLPDKDLTGMFHWDVTSALVQQMPRDEAMALVGKVANEALRKDPIGYFLFTFPLAWRQLVADPSHAILHTGLQIGAGHLLRGAPWLGFSAGACDCSERVSTVFAYVWVGCCWLAAASVLLLPWARHRRLAFGFVWIPAIYSLLSAAVEYFSDRYNPAITPFVAIAALSPFAMLWRRTNSTSATPPATGATAG